jgi:predicted ester cyclase
MNVTIKATLGIVALGLTIGTHAMANEATQTIAAFYKAVDDSRIPATSLSDYFAENFVDHNRPGQAPAGVPDRNVALNLFAELEKGFPQSIHKLEILEDLGADRAMVYWTFTGTQSGTFFGAPASHKSVTINGVDIFRVQNGKFVEQWHVEELMSLFQQIGAP